MDTSYDIYYKNQESLEMYQRLIQYWSILFDHKRDLKVLDNMNFSRRIFPEIFKHSELHSLNIIEPGYASPDSSTELTDIIKELEIHRLLHANNKREPGDVRRMIYRMGVGCGNGCTNVVNNLINCVLKYKEQLGVSEPEIIIPLPNYTVYAAQLSNVGNRVKSVVIDCVEEHGFLPTYDDVAEKISENTVAFILTYPNNPAQTVYFEDSVEELKKIIKLCQDNEVFLIVDNIYQDMIYDKSLRFTEIFDLCDRHDFLIKVYGCSKDTPFFSGYRTGYWIGDNRFSDTYRYFVSAGENSLNTLSNVYFGLNLFFKMKNLSGEELILGDLELFDRGIFGWGAECDVNALFSRIKENALYEKYTERMELSNGIQGTANHRIRSYLDQSCVFSDFINQKIGNVFFIRVNPVFFPGSDEDFFYWTLEKAKCGILPGNVFGMPIEKGNCWFRMTLIHEGADELINYLDVIQDALVRSSA